MALGDIGSFAKENPILLGGAVLGTGALVTATAVTVVKRRKKKKTTTKRKTYKRRTTKKKNGRRKPTKRRIRRTPRTAGKGRDTSTRRIRQTKNGQPYVILANGRARFIKKSSARRSRKLKGGRY